MKRVIVYVLLIWMYYCNCQTLLTEQQLVAQLGIEKLEDDGDDKVISNDQLLKEIAPQLYLKNIDHIIRYIRRAPIAFDQELGLLNDLLQNNVYGFSSNDIAHFILGVADSYTTDSKRKEQILDILLNFPYILENEDLLYMAAKHGYKHVLKTYLSWLKTKGLSTRRNDRFRALLHATKDNNLKAFILLDNVLQPITQHEASRLMWYSAHTGEGINLVAYLKSRGADVDVIYKTTTPLLEAVIRKDKAMVQELINAGANVNKITNNLELGSPLQQAIEKRDIEIESILRHAGAHE